MTNQDFTPKYTYEANELGEVTCKYGDFPPVSGKNKQSARHKMLRQVRKEPDVSKAEFHAYGSPRNA